MSSAGQVIYQITRNNALILMRMNGTKGVNRQGGQWSPFRYTCLGPIPRVVVVWPNQVSHYNLGSIVWKSNSPEKAVVIVI